MWQTKTWKTREEMDKWLDKREGTIQYDEIIVSPGYGVEWRKLSLPFSDHTTNGTANANANWSDKDEFEC